MSYEDEVRTLLEEDFPVTEDKTPPPDTTEAPGEDAQAPIAEQEKPQFPEALEAVQYQKKKKWKPHWSLRILLGLVSFILVLALTSSLTATVLVADLRLLTSGKNLQNLFSTFLTPDRSNPSPAPGATGVSTEELEQLVGEIDTDQITAELRQLAGSNDIFDEVYDAVTEQYEGELNIDREQLTQLYEQSTLPQMLADKLASCAEDVINGTSNTRITEEEIIAFIDENAAMIQQVFGVDVSPELKQKVLDFAKEIQLDTLLQDFVVSQISQIPLGDTGMTLETALAELQKYTSVTTLWILIGADLLLAVLIWLASWLRLGVSLRRISAPFLIVGGILSAPLILINSMASASATALGKQVADALIDPIEPVHYGILIAGAVLLIGGIIIGAATAEAQ